MKIRRRTFVGAALGALTVPSTLAPLFAQTSGPVRMTLPNFVKDPKRLASLRKGVAVMKSLPHPIIEAGFGGRRRTPITTRCIRMH